MKLKAQLLNESDINRVLKRISHQIIEKNRGTNDLCLIGIKSRGVPLAKRLKENIFEIDGNEVEVGELDITHYRDDIEKCDNSPVLTDTKVGFDITGKTVVLVDDVIFTGRTARAALDAVLDLGRPQKIQLCVLIDRGHSELPIKANFVGKNIPTSLDEVVAVRLVEYDGENSVAIYTK
ncbi:MAG: bifunctional pyr operon transcriptional regulator/uracil phosphoribosyltransferase PyrR [Ruminococcus sp.]|nr:bifunctional pyr operon transcriptional regulator/uracil phosphoribosyltransferase PyrR [Ruminococcus sp.]